jgi:hypothetical protein
VRGPRNQLGFVRTLLYQLKQQYGAPADVYYESADSVDLTTGERTVTKQKYRIRRAVCLPTLTSAETLYPAAVKAIWKRDAAVEAGTKVVLVDRRDLPEGLTLGTHNWSLVIDRRRYEVTSVEEFESRTGYVLTLRELKGARAYEQVDAALRDDVGVTRGS